MTLDLSKAKTIRNSEFIDIIGSKDSGWWQNKYLGSLSQENALKAIEDEDGWMDHTWCKVKDNAVDNFVGSFLELWSCNSIIKIDNIYIVKNDDDLSIVFRKKEGKHSSR